MTAKIPGTRKRPPILVGLPVVRDDDDEATKNATAVRNAAWINGVCDACGARPVVIPHPELAVAAITFWHQPECPVVALLDPHDP